MVYFLQVCCLAILIILSAVVNPAWAFCWKLIMAADSRIGAFAKNGNGRFVNISELCRRSGVENSWHNHNIDHSNSKVDDNNRFTETAKRNRRRQVVFSLLGLSGLTTGLSGIGYPAHAAITDETDTFGDNWWSSSSENSVSSATTTTMNFAPTDELVISVPKTDLQSKDGIGLELGEVEFRTNRRVFIKSVTSGSIAERLGIQKDWVLVSIDGNTTERTNVEGVAIMVNRAASADDAGDVVTFQFRDPAIFQARLKNLSSTSGDGTVTTQVAPAGDTTQRNPDGSVQRGRSITQQADQRLSVSQLIPPKLCKRGAQTDDLLEISYIGKVVETGTVFDGSAVKINGEGIAGRGNDVSIYFVLGKQPFGQFPPGWDIGLVGMCVGERRRLTVPPALAYGSTGLPRRGIPPDATLQYDVTLLSLNGLATPQ